MTRTAFAVVSLLTLAPVSRAQDMPLSQILIDGGGWKKAGPEMPPHPLPGVLTGTITPEGNRPTAYHVTADGTTLYVGYPESRAVVAFTLLRPGLPKFPLSRPLIDSAVGPLG